MWQHCDFYWVQTGDVFISQLFKNLHINLAHTTLLATGRQLPKDSA